MNYGLILAGGMGTRLKLDNIPKQYLMVYNRPIISYCLSTFQINRDIDAIVIVADSNWQDMIKKWLEKENIEKFIGFANPGDTRQHSILNGLIYIDKYAKNDVKDDDIVIIHDAARPLLSRQVISDCIKAAKASDGAMPVIPVKDTIYQSATGKSIDGLLNRDKLYAGQAPESFKFRKYLEIHKSLPDDEIRNIKGSSEIAYKNGMNITLVKGSENNFKITTKEDYEKFKLYLKKGTKI